MCAVIKDLRKVALPFAAHVVRHYTLIAISQQAGPFPVSQKQQKKCSFGKLELTSIVLCHNALKLSIKCEYYFLFASCNGMFFASESA